LKEAIHMGKRNDLSRMNLSGGSYGAPAQPEVYRDRTPEEVISDGAMGIVQVTNLNAVTQLAMGSARQCDVKRVELLKTHPGLEGPLTGLLYNHVRLLAEVQNSIVNNDKRK
jgi:hypothetical protein